MNREWLLVEVHGHDSRVVIVELNMPVGQLFSVPAEVRAMLAAPRCQFVRCTLPKGFGSARVLSYLPVELQEDLDLDVEGWILLRTEGEEDILSARASSAAGHFPELYFDFHGTPEAVGADIVLHLGGAIFVEGTGTSLTGKGFWPFVGRSSETLGLVAEAVGPTDAGKSARFIKKAEKAEGDNVSTKKNKAEAEAVARTEMAGDVPIEVVDTPVGLTAMRFAVTNEVWEALMGAEAPSEVQLSEVELMAAAAHQTPEQQLRDYPVTNVTWFDAARAANKLSELHGLQPAYILHYSENDPTEVVSAEIVEDADGWRMPTVEEWQTLAKAGEQHKFPGSNDPNEVAWHSGNSGGRIHCVGELKPNAWGLYDMAGNAWEWTNSVKE